MAELELEINATPMPDIPPFVEVKDDGTVTYNFHPGQSKMMTSHKRRVVFVAGTRAGKSSAGPIWLIEEMRNCGPGNYMVVAPSYPLLYRGAFMEMNRLFTSILHLGEFKMNPWRFTVSPEGEKWLFAGTRWAAEKTKQPTVVFLLHASDPNALEALTAKACWADEAGQDEFKSESYEAIERRLSIDKGRMLITTTPYALNFLYTKLFRPWKQAKDSGGDHPHIDIIQCRSIDNPAFPMDEYLRQRDSMPFWRWDMMYNANFTLPSGLVYDCLPELEEQIRIPRFPIPQHWPVLCGLDFGGINTFGLFAAQATEDFQIPGRSASIPRGAVVLFREYFPRKAKPIQSHTQALYELAGKHGIERACGGARSEQQWRDEYKEAGLFVEKPDGGDMAAGIARAYGLFARGLIYAFDDLGNFWEDVFAYRYEVDPETGDVLPELKIVDQNSHHAADSFRYISSLIKEYVEDVGPLAGGASREAGYVDDLNGKRSQNTKIGIRVVQERGDSYDKLLRLSPAYTSKSGRLRQGLSSSDDALLEKMRNRGWM